MAEGTATHEPVVCSLELTDRARLVIRELVAKKLKAAGRRCRSRDWMAATQTSGVRTRGFRTSLGLGTPAFYVFRREDPSTAAIARWTKRGGQRITAVSL